MALRYSDQADLDRYFQLGYMEKSTCGPMLDRAWLFASENSYVVGREVTARPTKEVRVPAKAEPPLDDLELIGRVSRKLAMLSARHRRALELFYGDRGASCAERVKKHGRIVSLFEMVPAGRAMAKKAKAAAGKLEVRGDQLIQNAASIEESPRIASALNQAQKLKAEADEAYAAATQRVEAERVRKVPPPRFSREMGDDEL